jgi:hypothetical protein
MGLPWHLLNPIFQGLSELRTTALIPTRTLSHLIDKEKEGKDVSFEKATSNHLLKMSHRQKLVTYL